MSLWVRNQGSSPRLGAGSLADLGTVAILIRTHPLH